MKRKNHALPTDVPALQALVLQQQTLVAQQQATIASLHNDLNARKAEIDRLLAQLAKLRRLYFGRSSEKAGRQSVRLEQRLAALLTEETSQSARVEDPAVPPASRPSPVRRPWPSHLPREERCLEPHEPACPACGGDLKPLGEDVSEQLELIKSAFKVIKTRRKKKACARCDVIVQAPAPSHPIERGIAGPGLLARVMTAKYAEHSPLYRQSEIFARQGVTLSRATMAGWVGLCSNLLAPLADAVCDYVMDTGKVHVDDTPVDVLQPGKGKPKTGRLWVYVRDDRNAGSRLPPAVWFTYSPDRKGIHPPTHLAGFSGLLQADAYAGFNPLYEEGHICEVGCMAHARRKIHDIHVRHPSPTTTEALQRIGELYAIEADIRGRPAEERQQVREARTQPLLMGLESWIREKLTTLPRQADTAKAFNYLMNHWPALCYYAGDGWAEIDNNIAENALRMVSLGRKNDLFMGSDSGGDRAALMYTLIGSCKLNGVEPEAYLRHVLANIVDHPINKIKELLPWNLNIPAE
ncbi:IS66 family transposase [Sodalis sp. RH14]|uniref:IS66 family transposase n=1 Tax=Sodalis sp. RH14 TaxID=3394329 RepID=UPI0039B45DD0